MLAKIFGWIIRIVVIIFAIKIIISVLNYLGFEEVFDSAFQRYEEEGGSLFIEGPDDLDLLNDNEPIFGPGEIDTKSPIQVPEVNTSN